jgi:hypothetical protein
MSEPLITHQLICFYRRLNVIFVNSYRYPHQHMLRSFDNFAMNLEKIRSLQSPETKVVKFKISLKIQCLLQSQMMSLDDLIDIFGNQ